MFRLLFWTLILLGCTGSLRAQLPTSDDLREAVAPAAGPAGESAAAGGTASSAFGGPAPAELYDFLDGAASAPNGGGAVGTLFSSYVDDFSEAQARLAGRGGEQDRSALANETFGGMFGQTAWTAGRCRRAVLEMLNWLDARRRAGGAAATDCERLERQLLEDFAKGAGEHGAGLAAAAKQPDWWPAGGWTEAALTRLGAQVWDYSVPAARILEWVAARDSILAPATMGPLLEQCPDPASKDGLPELEAQLARVRGESFGSDVRAQASSRAVAEMEPLLGEVRSASEERRKAQAELASALGVKSLNSRADLQRLVRRRLRDWRGDQGRVAGLEVLLRRFGESEHRRQKALEAYRDALFRHEKALLAARPAGPATTGSSAAGTFSTGGGDLFDPIAPGSIGARIRREIYKSDLSARLKLLDLQVMEGVGLSARYKWQVDGNLEDKYVSRVDTWELESNVAIGDLIRGLVDLPFGVSIAAGEKLIMVRQFQSYGAAAKAIPKTPLGLPLTAERARKMEVGDFWSIPADVTFATGVGTGYSAGVFSAGASGSYVVSGRFRVQVFKTDAQHVRVRLVGTRSHGPGVSGSARFGIEVFGIRVLDRALERLVGVNLVNSSKGWSTGTNFSADYVFDLRNEDATGAYDKILNASLKTGPLLAANSLIKSARLDQAMLNDLRPAEELFHRDQALEPSRRRVNRMFKGLNEFSSSSRNLEVGIKLLRFDTGSSWVDNHLKVYNPDESTSDYSFPVYSSHDRWSALFGKFREDRDHSLYAVMPADTSGKALSLTDLVFTDTIQDKVATRGEMGNYRKRLERALGPSLADRMDLDQFLAGAADRFGLQFTLAVHGDTFARLIDPARTTEQAIWEAAARLVAEFDLFTPQPSEQGERQTGPWGYHRWSEARKKAHDTCKREWGESRWDSLDELISGLLAVQRLPASTSVVDRVTRFMELGKNTLFFDLMPRLIVELVAGDAEDAFFIAVGAQAKDRQPFGATLGEDRFRELYGAINEALYNMADRDR